MNNRIKSARKMRGLSQAELGELINCSKSFVCLIEQGKRQCSKSQIVTLSSALAVNEAWLATGNGPMTDHEASRDRRSIGERLYQVRKENHLTQKGMAEKLNVTRLTISLLERNKIAASPAMIRKAVEKMNIEEHWLRTGEKESRAEEIKGWLEGHPSDKEKIKEWINAG